MATWNTPREENVKLNSMLVHVPKSVTRMINAGDGILNDRIDRQCLDLLGT